MRDRFTHKKRNCYNCGEPIRTRGQSTNCQKCRERNKLLRNTNAAHLRGASMWRTMQIRGLV